MRNTKEKILCIALELFAQQGYEAVSVSQIAGALGMTKGVLYKHYQSKRDLFDQILARMEEKDAQQARAFQVPEETLAQMPQAYAKTSLHQLVEYSKAQFRYWTEDPWATAFRKMLTLEQYRSEEMRQLYQQYLGAGPLQYVTDLFTSLQMPEPRLQAVRFYAPMFLLYSVYDGGVASEEVLAVLEAHFTQFVQEQAQKS